MSRGEVIRALVADLAPVRRLAGAGARARRWAGLAIACVAADAAALGARADLADKLHQIGFLVENAALGAVFASAARCAFQLGVPGSEPSAPARFAPVLGFAAWLVALAIRASEAGLGTTAWTDGVPCAARIAGLALVPAVALFAMLHRAAFQAGGWTGLSALASPVALAVIGIQAVCAKDDPGHVLIWHAAPLVGAALLGIAARRPRGAPRSQLESLESRPEVS